MDRRRRGATSRPVRFPDGEENSLALALMVQRRERRLAQLPAISSVDAMIARPARGRHHVHGAGKPCCARNWPAEGHDEHQPRAASFTN